MITLKDKARYGKAMVKATQSKMTFKTTEVKAISSTDTKTTSHPENASKRKASKVEVVKGSDSKRKTSKRKLSVAGKLRKAQESLKQAELALRKLELESNPVMLKMIDQQASIKLALKLAKERYAKLIHADVKDKLAIAKCKVSVLKLEAEKATIAVQIDNCLNPKPAKPAKDSKTEADKLSETNLVKLSVSSKYNPVVY